MQLVESPIFKFNPYTLDIVRKAFDLNHDGFIEQSIDILEVWIKQQAYFNKKDFDRSYLERIIISCKGSVEKAKSRLDKICCFRTIAPKYYDLIKARDIPALGNCFDAILPRMTINCDRIFLVSVDSKIKVTDELFVNYMKRAIFFAEYFLENDYASGYIAVFDGRNCDIKEFLKALGRVELYKHLSMIFESYFGRVQALHFLVPHVMYYDAIIFATRHLFSEKMQKRWHFHRNLESLHEMVDKELLPAEYGGKEESIYELNRKWIEVLSSDGFMEIRKEHTKATINTSLKSIDDCYKQFKTDFGFSGTFRQLNVD